LSTDEVFFLSTSDDRVNYESLCLDLLLCVHCKIFVTRILELILLGN